MTFRKAEESHAHSLQTLDTLFDLGCIARMGR